MPSKICTLILEEFEKKSIESMLIQHYVNSMVPVKIEGNVSSYEFCFVLQVLK